ncbi:MAG TPA: AraC family transcriptional regulator [Caulobacteraceae bacterium]|jgi:AraC-like DNA-binding protein
MRHGARQELARHPHEHGFAAVVLSGGYVEAGDTGRHQMAAGDVLFHQPWESHLDRFGGSGAEVLVLPLCQPFERVAGRLDNPDALVRLAEADVDEAAHQVTALVTAKPATAADWPDLLAAALRTDPELSIAEWAHVHGLHLGSISRGFRQVFGVAPVSFRLVQRTRRALEAAQRTCEPLCDIAVRCGFADQAHMSRAVSALTRHTPSQVRRAAAAR